MVHLLLGVALEAAGAPLVAPDFDPRASLSPLVQAVDPAVVTIEVESRMEIPPHMVPFLRQFGFPEGGDLPMQEGEGSGFLISADGLLLTNHHVVNGADGIHVVFSDGRKVDATVVGGDPDIDVALLRLVEKGPWPYVALGDSESLEVGDWVVAMGNGLGLGTTATLGIVSGKGRVLGHSVLGREDFIQTDAAINQGNSGGPLFDLDGKVVGISTAIIQGANTAGFAIPSSLVASVLDDLQRTGRVARGFLGVSPQTLDDEMRAALGIKASVDGVLVADVTEGSPAAKAGMIDEDVILTIDGEEIEDPTDLVDTVSRRHPGERVDVRIWRQGKERTLTVELGERPGPVQTRQVNLEPGDGAVSSDVGITLAPLSPAVAAQAKVDHGVLVQSVQRGTPADGRLAPGDVILEVNRNRVDAPDQVMALLAKSRPGTVAILVARGELRQFVALPID
jgi:serine protease Do